MPRRVLIETPDGSAPILEELDADSEQQLQELIKGNPDLLPIEDFGMTGPLLVVGRETQLPAGAVDLVALARSGELLIIEFKTGPQNADFRHAAAQLIDYGAHIAGLSVDEFEALVPLRYFASAHCDDDRFRNLTSLSAAADVAWEGLGADEWTSIREHLEKQLADGTFHYVLAAQRFTETMSRTLGYLNRVSSPSFYAVEVVRFAADNYSAFEARTVLKPSTVGSTPERDPLDVERFLKQFDQGEYRDFVEELIRLSGALGCAIYWGTVGISIRVPNPDRKTPLSVLWLNPPGKAGWLGLRDLTLGFDSSYAENLHRSRAALEAHVAGAGALAGASAVTVSGLSGFTLGPADAVSARSEILELLASVRSELQAE